MGSKLKAKDQYLLYINHVLPLGRLRPEKKPRILGDKRWKDTKNKLKILYPNQEIIGWYGVRKGWQAMLTEQDQDIHSGFFNKPWHILYLLDNIANVSGVFTWDAEGRKLRLSQGHYECYDSNNKSQVPKFYSYKSIAMAMALVVVMLTVAVFTSGRMNAPNDDYLKNLLSKKPGSESQAADDELHQLVQSEKEQSIKNETSESDSKPAGNKDSGSPGEATGEREPDMAEPQQGNCQEEDSQKGSISDNIQEYQNKIDELEKDLKEKKDTIELLEGRILGEASGDIVEKAQGVIYTIQRGDNLYKISKEFYGSDKYADFLAKANRIKNQKTLRIGDYLVIPTLEEE